MSLTSVPMVGDKELLARYGPLVRKDEVTNSLEFERLRRKGYYTVYTEETYGWTEHARTLVKGTKPKGRITVVPYGPNSPQRR